MGHAGLALALAELDGPDRVEAQRSLGVARSCSPTVSRYERHHAEVVALALDGASARASALALEHLAEFPDEIVRYAVARWCGTDVTPG